MSVQTGEFDLCLCPGAVFATCVRKLAIPLRGRNGKGSRVSAVILIVEDQPLHAKLFRDILQLGGFDAVTAASGREATTVAAGTRPDLILLDVLLPDLDGREVIAVLKRAAPTRGIRVLAISASPDREVMDECLAAGADAFMAKPVRMADLLARVGTMLGVRA